MNILEMSMGNNEYSKFESAVYADGSKTIVTVSRTLSPGHVDLDSPSYVETKFKKHIPILTKIGVVKNKEADEQTINVTVEVNGAFNGINHLNHLVGIAAIISEITEDKLSEPEAVKNVGLDCKPFVHDESEEEKREDA